jgi:hypothetical protein
MHRVENQWEAPFFYADEHSTFYVQGDETHHTVRDVDDYIPIAVAATPIHLDDLYEEVIVERPLDPIWDPPWKRLVNPRITTVLAADVSFELDGQRFDALGLRR